VNGLGDNNRGCQGAPEVAHAQAWRRPLANAGIWAPVAPLPWPTSHVGLATVAVGGDALIVSGKAGRAPTPRVAAYDAFRDVWRELRPLPWGQPDFLAYAAGGHLHVVKFRWRPTNTTLGADYASYVHGGEARPWPRAFYRARARVLYELAPAPARALPGPAVALEAARLAAGFGAAVRGANLGALLPAAPTALGAALRGLLDEHALLVLRGAGRLDAAQLVALHSLFEHDLAAAPASYHRGMCRLWRAGLPEVNVLANRAVAAEDFRGLGALDDAGAPCAAGSLYGMEAFAWHADEASRPGDKPVRVTAFHALAVPEGAGYETHFLDGRRAVARLAPATRARLGTMQVTYASNAESLDAFLAPWAATNRTEIDRRVGTSRGSTISAASRPTVLKIAARGKKKSTRVARNGCQDWPN